MKKGIGTDIETDREIRQDMLEAIFVVQTVMLVKPKTPEDWENVRSQISNRGNEFLPAVRLLTSPILIKPDSHNRDNRDIGRFILAQMVELSLLGLDAKEVDERIAGLTDGQHGFGLLKDLIVHR